MRTLNKKINKIAREIETRGTVIIAWWLGEITINKRTCVRYLALKRECESVTFVRITRNEERNE